MCGAYGFSVKVAKATYDRFEVVNTLEDLKPRWNVRPGQMNPVVTSHSPNRMSRMFWGLIPAWAKDKSFGYKTINARAETIATLPTFRQPLRNKRCIVPATGFYEPDKIHYEKPPYPWHYFTLKDQELFGFAGLYDIWKDKQTGSEIYSYTIITTTPNELVGQVHDRMPVILDREVETEWLNPDLVETERLLQMLKPYPADKMEVWKVGDEARNPRNDYAELIRPLH
jgi:putative SOS response-associated peptidase YedK